VLTQDADFDHRPTKNRTYEFQKRGTKTKHFLKYPWEGGHKAQGAIGPSDQRKTLCKTT
jgi:hypothetical protein